MKKDGTSTKEVSPWMFRVRTSPEHGNQAAFCDLVGTC